MILIRAINSTPQLRSESQRRGKGTHLDRWFLRKVFPAMKHCIPHWALPYHSASSQMSWLVGRRRQEDGCHLRLCPQINIHLRYLDCGWKRLLSGKHSISHVFVENLLYVQHSWKHCRYHSEHEQTKWRRS